MRKCWVKNKTVNPTRLPKAFVCGGFLFISSLKEIFMTNDLIKGELLPEQQQAVLQAMTDIQA
jgi:hypothetical protein